MPQCGRQVKTETQHLRVTILLQKQASPSGQMLLDSILHFVSDV